MAIDKHILIKRLKEAYSIKTDTELAKLLEIAPTTLSSWKSRNSFDFDTIYAKCVDINWNYLVYGVGPHFIKSMEPNDGPPTKQKNETFRSEIEVLRSIAEKNDQLVGILIQEINRLRSELDRIEVGKSSPGQE